GGLPETFADSYIANGTATGDVALAILRERARMQPPISQSVGVEVGRSHGVTRLVEGMFHALMARVAPAELAKQSARLPEGGRADLAAAARDWTGKTLLEFGRACLEARGIHVRGVDRMKVAAYALGLEREGPHGFITTSDFPTLLKDIGR